MYSPCGHSWRYMEPMTIMQIGMTMVTPNIMEQPTKQKKDKKIQIRFVVLPLTSL